jgi:hypothetical protein
VGDEARLLKDEAINFLHMAQNTDDEGEAIRLVLLAAKCLERVLELEPFKP